MPVPHRSVSNRDGRHLGFTLIEMVVVITIISLAALLILPRLPSTDDANLRSSARSLAAVLRYLGDQSVTAKTSHRLHLNLMEGTIGVTRRNAAGEYIPVEDTFLGRRVLAEGITMEDVQVPRLGKVSDGEVAVDYGVAGLEEFMVIHLLGSRNSHFTVAAFPHSGKVKVYEGYREDEL